MELIELLAQDAVNINVDAEIALIADPVSK